MKNKILSSFVIAFSLVFSQLALADTVTTVEETTTVQGVPITVDTVKHTYTLEGTAVEPTGSYYYTYPGYRCYKEKREIMGVNAVIFNASVSGGSDIYCYKE